MITQTEIQRLQRLRRQICKLEEKEKALGSQILQKYDNFEEVEPGVFSIEVNLQRSMVFSNDALLAAIGRNRLRNLKARVQPTECQVVNVRSTYDKHDTDEFLNKYGDYRGYEHDDLCDDEDHDYFSEDLSDFIIGVGDYPGLGTIDIEQDD